jgi:DNA polymerase V
MFALVDCNNFYVSCERVFNPKIRDKPVVVLSNNDGCVVSRSNEIKKLGIPIGMPFFKYKTILEEIGAEVFSSNYRLYGDLSHRVMEVLREYANIEIYSIDEAFLDLSHIQPDRLEKIALEIKAKVEKHTGIPVSVGIAKTKTLAKAASEITKIDSRGENKLGGVMYLEGRNDIDQLLNNLDISDVWGIGRSYSKLLKSHAISNAKHLKYMDEDWVKQKMGTPGVFVKKELQGIKIFDLNFNHEARKGIISSRSFGQPVTDINNLRQAIANFVSRGAEKLRSQSLVPKFMYIYVTTGRFDKINAYRGGLSQKLPISTNFTPELLKQAFILLDKVFKKGYKYKKAGVAFYGLGPKSSAQLQLFESNQPISLKAETIMKTVDKINLQYGQKTIQLASQGLDQNAIWTAKNTLRSRCFTTSWDELLEIKD